MTGAQPPARYDTERRLILGYLWCLLAPVIALLAWPALAPRHAWHTLHSSHYRSHEAHELTAVGYQLYRLGAWIALIGLTCLGATVNSQAEQATDTARDSAYHDCLDRHRDDGGVMRPESWCEYLSPSASPPTTSTPLTGRWRTLDGTCPTLTGDGGRRLGATGAGTPTTAAYVDTAVLLDIDCTWTRNGWRPNVEVAVTIIRADTGDATAEQAAARKMSEAEQDATSTARTNPNDAQPPQPVPGLGDAAFLLVQPHSQIVHLTTRWSNALIRLTYRPQHTPDTGQQQVRRLAAYQPDLQDIAADVFADLR